MKVVAMKVVAMKVVAMKAMKAAKKAIAMKPKAMKPKAMKVAVGKLAKALVLRGSRERTSGGLKKANIIKNKNGKAVSKAQSARGKANFKGSALEKWIKACQGARKAMATKGFTVIGGNTAQGKALYAKAKALYTKA